MKNDFLLCKKIFAAISYAKYYLAPDSALHSALIQRHIRKYKKLVY